MALFSAEPDEVLGGGVIADAVKAYLEQKQKTVNEAVLAEMQSAFRRTVLKQLMQVREDRKGYESTTLYSGPCARKSRLTYDGAEKEPTTARTMLKFLLGDVVELTVLGIGKAAGLDLQWNNIDLTIQSKDGPNRKLIAVHPDGLLSHEGKHYNVEIKSCDTRTFDRWIAEGGPSDTFGYLTQASVEIQAWREAGLADMGSTKFVAISTGSRIGSVMEWDIPYDPLKVLLWHERRSLARDAIVPPVPFEPEKETKFVKGQKHPTGSNDDARPKFDKNDKLYGFDVDTGRLKLPMICSYCDYKKTGGCWPTARMEMKSGSPIWIVPKPAKLQIGAGAIKGQSEAAGQANGIVLDVCEATDTEADRQYFNQGPLR